MLDFYKERIEISNKFAKNLENLLKTEYQPAVDAIRKIYSNLENRILYIRDEFEPLKQFFNGHMIIGKSWRTPDNIIDYFNTEPLDCTTDYAANFLRNLVTLGRMTGIGIDVSCKLYERELASKIPKIAELLRKDTNLDYLGLTSIIKGHEEDTTKATELRLKNLIAYYEVPIVRIWPAYGVASIINRNIREYPLILNGGEKYISRTLDNLNYSLIEPNKLEQVLKIPNVDFPDTLLLEQDT